MGEGKGERKEKKRDRGMQREKGEEKEEREVGGVSLFKETGYCLSCLKARGRM